MKFTLSAIKQETSDTFSFIFAPEEALQWKAGQLLRYVLNHANPRRSRRGTFFLNRVGASRKTCDGDDTFRVEE